MADDGGADNAFTDVVNTGIASLLWSLIFIPAGLPLMAPAELFIPSNGEGIDDTSGYTALAVGVAAACALGAAFGARRNVRKHGRPYASITALLLLGALTAFGTWAGIATKNEHWPDVQASLPFVLVFPFLARIAVLVTAAIVSETRQKARSRRLE